MPAGGKGARGREGGRLCLFPRPLQSPPRAHVRLLVALEGFSPAARWLRIVRRYCRAYWHSHFGAVLVLRIKPRLNHEKKVMTSPARRPHLAFKHMQSEDGGAPSGCARPDVCTCPPRRVWQSPQPFPSPPPQLQSKRKQRCHYRNREEGGEAWWHRPGRSCPQNLPALPYPQARVLRFAPPAASPREQPRASREQNSQFPGSRQLKPSRTLLLKPKH